MFARLKSRAHAIRAELAVLMKLLAQRQSIPFTPSDFYTVELKSKEKDDALSRSFYTAHVPRWHHAVYWFIRNLVKVFSPAIEGTTVEMPIIQMHQQTILTLDVGPSEDFTSANRNLMDTDRIQAEYLLGPRSLSRLDVQQLSLDQGVSLLGFLCKFMKDLHQNQLLLLERNFVALLPRQFKPRNLMLTLGFIFYLRYLQSSKKITVVVPLYDTYSPLINSSLLLIFVRRKLVVIPLTHLCDEVRGIGFDNIAVTRAPLLWSRRKMKELNIHAGEEAVKRYDLMVPSRGGTERIKIAKVAVDEALTLDLSFTFSGLTPGYEMYLKTMGQCRAVLNTNLVQSYFQDELFGRHQHSHATTGRVWEVFFVGSLLICNSTPILYEFGFRPGLHYLEIAEGGNGIRDALSTLKFKPRLAEEIARKGRLHFYSILN